MPTYVRPGLDLGPQLRDDGLPYGNDWPDPTPEATYSRVSHPERFAPLHAVADALLTHLVETYDVTIDDDPPLDAFPGDPFAVVRVVGLVPATDDAPPLTIAWTPFPGIRLHAGAAADVALPACGCDACDDDIESLLDELEGTVLAVVSGGLSESVRDRQLTTSIASRRHRRNAGPRAGSGVTSQARFSSTEAERLRAVLAVAPDGWAPWPLRS